MSKIKLLLDIVTDMTNLAESIKIYADTIENGKEDTNQSCKQSTKENKTVTLEEVRAILADKSQQGLTAKVRELLEKYGSNRLSEIKPEHYSDLLSDAEKLTNE